MHIAVDEKHQFIASTLTTYHEGDPGQVPILLDQLENPFSTFMADGAYDSPVIYQKLQSVNPEARIIIPPPKTALLPDKPEEEMSQREKHIFLIKNEGRMAWQNKTGYGLRNYSELDFYRYKQIIGSKLKARKFSRQKTESRIGCIVLNKMTSLGMSDSIKIA